MHECGSVNLAKKHRPDTEAGFFVTAAAAFAISLAVTIYFCSSMPGGMDMPGGWTLSMIWMRMPGQSWFAATAMFMLMWLAMMVAMMLPSALAMLRSFRAAQYHVSGQRAGVLALLTAVGYFFVWFSIGACVYAAGVVFALVAMRYSGFSHDVPLLSGAAMAASGAIQFTPWKLRALRRCRGREACSPIHATSRYRAAWRQGIDWGLSCAESSSGLMLVLLVLGMMNLIVMVIVAVLIALEKLMPNPEWIVRGAGLTIIGAGAFMLLQSLV
jgi:predicted metal-binding membrane protein